MDRRGFFGSTVAAVAGAIASKLTDQPPEKGHVVTPDVSAEGHLYGVPHTHQHSMHMPVCSVPGMPNYHMYTPIVGGHSHCL